MPLNASHVRVAVKRAILNGLRDMHGVDLIRFSEIGNGPCDTQDASMRPRRQPKPGHGVFEQVLGWLIKTTIPLHLARLQLGIGVDAVAPIPPTLAVTSRQDP